MTTPKVSIGMDEPFSAEMRDEILDKLEGRIDESFVARPELPEDGPSTPQPES